MNGRHRVQTDAAQERRAKEGTVGGGFDVQEVDRWLIAEGASPLANLIPSLDRPPGAPGGPPAAAWAPLQSLRIPDGLARAFAAPSDDDLLALARCWLVFQSVPGIALNLCPVEAPPPTRSRQQFAQELMQGRDSSNCQSH
jgi:hypothetical protein